MNDIEQQLKSRLRELQPTVDEYAEIKRTLDLIAQGRASAKARGSASRRAPSHSSTDGSGRAGQAVELIRMRPGITVRESGKLRKVGNGYEAA
jgi:hypothetical protein